MAAAEVLDDEGGALALAALRRARRRRRVADLDRFEALYRVYLAGFLGSLGIVMASNLAGDTRVTPSELAAVRRDGPAVVGLVLAAVLAVGVRSGGRGGPLALAAADVRHVLLAPIDRGIALRGPALRQVRSGAFAGVVVGGTVGINASHRLPGHVLEWVLVGSAVGCVTTLAAFGAALVVGGSRLGRRVSGLLALLLLGWSVLDLSRGITTSPLTLLGSLALAPLHFDPLDLAGLVVVLLAPVGLRIVGGSSLEAAEERARLVGQMRFGATLGDVRTVLVLRRQLAQERPRSRPWIRIARPAIRIDPLGTAPVIPAVGATGAGGRGATVRPSLRLPTSIAVRRSLWALSRWPAARFLRMAVLACVAGVTMAAVWRGTKALIVPAGLCAYVAALDAIEPMAQQVDHPDRTESAPRIAGQLRAKLLIVPIVLMAVLGVIGIVAAIVAGADPDIAIAVGIPTVVATAVLACAGAATSTLLGPDFGGSSVGLGPEVQGMKEMFRFGFPPLCCILGLVPVLVAEAAAAKGQDPGAAAAQVMFPLVGVLAVLVLGWVRFREDVRDFFTQSQEAAREQSKENAERKRAQEEDE